MAGGGVASPYDPIDATQYTEPEIRAAVEAAENWGTYVAVHAYTPRAIQIAVAAGVKCIDHGQLIDEPTAELLAQQEIWLSLQPFLDDEDAVPLPDPAQRRKAEEVLPGRIPPTRWQSGTASGSHSGPTRSSIRGSRRAGGAVGQAGAVVPDGRRAQDGDRRQRRAPGALRATQPVSRQAGRRRGGCAGGSAPGRWRSDAETSGFSKIRRENFSSS